MAEEPHDQLESLVPPVAGPGSPGAAAALRAEAAPAETAPAETAKPPAAAAKPKAGKSTEYVVFRSEDRDGPFELVGTYVTQGQTNAKREGAKTVGIEDAEKYFFTAIPTSSFRPEKPSITLQISFATEDAVEETPEDDE